VTAPLDDHSDTIPAGPPEGCEDHRDGDDHETMLPPPPEGQWGERGERR
jgi:hypothetical protein